MKSWLFAIINTLHNVLRDLVKTIEEINLENNIQVPYDRQGLANRQTGVEQYTLTFCRDKNKKIFILTSHCHVLCTSHCMIGCMV